MLPRLSCIRRGFSPNPNRSVHTPAYDNLPLRPVRRVLKPSPDGATVVQQSLSSRRSHRDAAPNDVSTCKIDAIIAYRKHLVPYVQEVQEVIECRYVLMRDTVG